MSNTAPVYKKLIEVAMPIKEVSAESVRDNSIRRGHISTLHLWWARRPLPVCRAVVFASLVPDPDDPNCPPAFRDAVELVLGKSAGISGDPYMPYDDIPYTSAVDRLDDTLRNRLLMFVGKFSDTFARNEKVGKVTASKDQISIHSLVRWESKNDEAIIGRARRLIWVAHNTAKGSSATAMLQEFDEAYNAILASERDLYSTTDWHLATEGVNAKQSRLHEALETFLDRMPRVFDPFAGGGAIPLEAARLGCRSFGNDINPVAHVIQRSSLEFPQRYGKPITYSRKEFVARYGEEELRRQQAANSFLGERQESVKIMNRLSFDVGHYARKLIEKTRIDLEEHYPLNINGIRPIAYNWCRVGTCSNPSCRAEVPLLKGFYLSKRRKTASSKWVYLNPVISGNKIEFEIKNGECQLEGWVQNRKSLKCPCCGNITTSKELKKQFASSSIKERMLTSITEVNGLKYYELPSELEISIAEGIQHSEKSITEKLPKDNTKQFDICLWGILEYGQMFSRRQMLMMETLVSNLHEIKNDINSGELEFTNSILTYLALLIDRVAARNTSYGVWHILQETVEHPFGRQAIPMVFDYPEMNPFGSLSGGINGQLKAILNYINEEDGVFYSICNNASSGDISQFSHKSLDSVVTDPPYYNAIAYADLSDFFYVWLKRTIGDLYPLNFAIPQTPKAEECTALKHYHSGSLEKANSHFRSKLQQIFKAIEYQTKGTVSIMFAHQTTEAWTTLCDSILGANMNITGSWSVDTEVTGALKADKAYLSSSVTVSCRPTSRVGYGSYREVKREIESTVQYEVEELYSLGFRGADLLTACFGQAVSVFGKYERVEKADGSDVTVAELLEMARESAFTALLKGFEGDDHTKFYIAWLQLYGFGEADFDDAAKFSRVGLSINVGDLVAQHLFSKKGNKLTLAGFVDRVVASKTLGEAKQSILIDQVHRALALYKAGNRQQLLIYVGKHASTTELPFWRVLTALVEVLPAGSDDQKQASGLLADKESVLRESTQLAQQRPSLIQGQLELS